MPFTLAHPAAIVPVHVLARGRLRLAALALGAASPDFQYFLPLDTERRFAHSLPGLILFCLPAGWLALVLFDRWGRRGVQALLPIPWRLPPPPVPPRPLLATTAALLVGALTHVVWDSFTHASGWGVQHLPMLRGPVFPPLLSVQWLKVLQHGSSLMGLAVLAYVCLRWMQSQPVRPWSQAIGRTVGVGLVLAGLGVLNGLRFVDQGFAQFIVAGGLAVIAGLGLGLLLLGWLSTPTRV
jgi:uncharacterized protein DUF4184